MDFNQWFQKSIEQILEDDERSRKFSEEIDEEIKQHKKDMEERRKNFRFIKS
ncbi:hypothetical protein LC087_19075 (plasmid) [Bacillus carboniphilus]|uniref:Uncharacterized protein n=1 Tax=Bacillus carboniphilus TaxID=86663 RepID=A0ABY9JYE1_9BACI|nr:hypothetical protein [Bacillus carboniphilus]WLR44411.1 hypothetical protein LC087_19075 [Bacillus carboniphilus]